MAFAAEYCRTCKIGAGGTYGRKYCSIPKFDTYDTVFIGYPIWWREASWVVDEFVKNNNFTGKSVVTFCTSISTGTGESRKRLEKLAKTGNWVTGERFPSSFSEVSVKAWLKGLGF